ncbi:MAG: hypothetical protein ACI9NC_003518, partial [Verrucomicrobiales bacterium]
MPGHDWRRDRHLINDSWERVVIEKLVDPMERKQFSFLHLLLPLTSAKGA